MPPLLPSSTSMSGKVAVVTGANSGLGMETTKALIQKGAVVVMACRDMSRTELVIARLSEGDETKRNRMVPMALDLGSMSSIRSFCSDLLSRFDRIHLVVCNAGVMFPMEEHRRTSDGFEANVGINHLGHFLLVTLIKDRLVQSAPSRVVVVSSILLKEGEVHLSNLNCDLGIRASSDPSSTTPVGYADSKLMNALFALELRRRMQLLGGGVDVYCVSPGWCRTKLHQNTVSISCLKWPLLLLAAAVFMKSASKGSETIVHCCCSNKVTSENSLFYRNSRPMDDMNAWLEKKSDLAKELWTKSCQLVGVQSQEED